MLKIGYITRYQGNKGEIRTIIEDDFIKSFEKLEILILKFPNDRLEIKKIESIRHKNQFFIIKLADINSINDAEQLKNAEIYMKDEDLVPLEDGVYYNFQLIGLKVFTNKGRELGILDSIINNSYDDVFVVKKQQKEYLIPAVPEIIDDINLKEKKVIISPVEGLLEL